MTTAVLDTILELLTREGVTFNHVTHEPTRTSADAARVRGASMLIGGKALVMKAHDKFHLFVLSAERRLDSAAVRRFLDTDRVRFATPEELLDLTTLVPGSVPPFGEPILPVPPYVDQSTLVNDRIAFNAGSLTNSVVMPVQDYRRVANIRSVVEVAEAR